MKCYKNDIFEKIPQNLYGRAILFYSSFVSPYLLRSTGELKCNGKSSVGGVVFADEFDPMSVHSTNCNPVFSHSSGSEPEGVFNLNSLVSWGCGVMDIIGGFEPLDPGSTPGTLAGLSLLNGCVNVADITWDCDSLDLGSIPSTPTKSK